MLVIGALIATAGMLYQIEKRNWDDRSRHRFLGDVLDARREGKTSPEARSVDAFWPAVANSWASTWPVVGLIALTLSCLWIANIITDSSGGPDVGDDVQGLPQLRQMLDDPR